MAGTDPWGFGQGSGGGGGQWPATTPAGPGVGGFGVPAPTVLTPAEPTNPPVIWLALSALAAIAGGVVAGLFGTTVLPALGGWLLGGPGALGLAAVFAWQDTVRRAKPSPRVPGWVGPAYVVCLVLALLAILVASARLAFWFGYLYGEQG